MASSSSGPPADSLTMLQFVPWQSAVDVGFWQKLAHRKLDEFGLSEAEQLIFGHYMPCNHAQVSC